MISGVAFVTQQQCGACVHRAWCGSWKTATLCGTAAALLLEQWCLQKTHTILTAILTASRLQCKALHTHTHIVCLRPPAPSPPLIHRVSAKPSTAATTSQRWPPPTPRSCCSCRTASSRASSSSSCSSRQQRYVFVLVFVYVCERRGWGTLWGC